MFLCRVVLGVDQYRVRSYAAQSVGLDDQMRWSYSPKNPEGIATLFCGAFTGKTAAIFTFCRARGERTRVADLYELLSNAGVPEVNC